LGSDRDGADNVSDDKERFGWMAPSESGEGEDDDREQEQEAEPVAGDCEQAVRVYSVGEHGFPRFAKMVARSSGQLSMKTGRSGSEARAHPLGAVALEVVGRR